MNILRCIVDIGRMRRTLSTFVKPVILMAKADCYGLGLEVAKALDDTVYGYGVAFGDEGKQLRKQTQRPILVTTPGYDVQDIVSYGLTPMVSTVHEVRRLHDAQQHIGVHIKLNTGMNRFGVKSLSALAELLDEIAGDPYLHVAGVATHYASAKEFCTQNRAANRMLSYLYTRVGRVPYHSEATSTCRNECGDMLRLGMAVYKDAVTLHTQVLACCYLAQGEHAGYDGVYRAPHDQTLAIVAGGYADGISKSMVGHRILICGHLCPIVAVCMDVCMVAVYHRVAVGDQVCILSPEIPLPPLSLYEMYTNIGKRFEKEYVG